VQSDQHTREDFAGGSTIRPMLSEGFDIKPSDLEAEYATLIGDYWWHFVEIVIGGVPTIREVGFMYFFMSLSRILLQCSVLMNRFYPMKHQVDLWKVEVGI